MSKKEKNQYPLRLYFPKSIYEPDQKKGTVGVKRQVVISERHRIKLNTAELTTKTFH